MITVVIALLLYQAACIQNMDDGDPLKSFILNRRRRSAPPDLVDAKTGRTRRKVHVAEIKHGIRQPLCIYVRLHTLHTFP